MSETPALSSSPGTIETDPAPAAPESEIALRALGLVKHYGRLQVVKGLDMTVPKGKIYGFLGRNGAGKTTTIRMLMGILQPTGGQIEFFGKRTKRTTTPLKRRIGYVSQSQHYYPWMNARQLGKFVSSFYPTWDHAEYNRLLQVLELPFDRRTSQLSGGMRMKLALALALAHHPELLILDEPTAGLDPVAQREFLEIVKNQSRNHGRTTLFSTHRIDEVERVADKVGIIDEGIMRYEGDLDNLRAEVRRITEKPRVAAAAPSLPDTPSASPLGSLPVLGEAAALAVEDSPAAPSTLPGESEPASEAMAAATAATPTQPPPIPTQPAANPFAEQPDHYELLRDESLPDQRRYIYRSSLPDPWSGPAPTEWEIEKLSLEDIFLAYAGMKVAEV